MSLLREIRLMKYLTLITVLLITFATQSMSGETVMVCDADNNESRYYKLVKPLFGPSKVKQKVDSRWKDWCRKNPNWPEYSCNLEIYSSGAKLTGYDFVINDKTIFKETDISVGLKMGDKLTEETTILIDFEFGKRSVSEKYYINEKISDIKTWRVDKEYSCEIK